MRIAPERRVVIRVALRTVLPLLAYLAVAILASWWLVRFPGVPFTHDGLSVERVEIYRRAFKAGDWFPLWTPFLAGGHGSPYPVLYHRLHSTIFGALALLTGSLVAAKASVPILLVVGAMGMRRLCLHYGARPWVAWTAGTLLVTSNYTVTDWFVRGAIPEFTAFMLIPWGIYFVCRLFETTTRRSAIAAAVASMLLFFAHGPTFYYFAFIVFSLLIAHVHAIWPLGMRRVRESAARVLLYGGVLLLGIAVPALAQIYSVKFTGIAAMASDILSNSPTQYRPLFDYLLDPKFTWLHSPHTRELSLEIGRWFVFLTALIVIVVPDARRALRSRAWALVLPGLVFFLLQPFNMRGVFEYLPGGTRIQFSFRLLVYIIPIAILTCAIAAEAALRAKGLLGRVLAYALPLAAIGQLHLAYDVQFITVDIIPKEKVLEAINAPDPDSLSSVFSMQSVPQWDGFLPLGLRTIPPTPYLSAGAGCGLSAEGFAGGRTVSTIEPYYRWPSTRVTVHGTGCTVKLSQFLAPFIDVRLSSAGLVHAAEDGTTLIDAPIDGTIVTIREQSIFHLASKWLRQQETAPP